MTDKFIIDLWKSGCSLEYICRLYKAEIKRKKSQFITLYQAQKYIEPIIYNYQLSLLKLGVSPHILKTLIRKH